MSNYNYCRKRASYMMEKGTFIMPTNITITDETKNSVGEKRNLQYSS